MFAKEITKVDSRIDIVIKTYGKTFWDNWKQIEWIMDFPTGWGETVIFLEKRAEDLLDHLNGRPIVQTWTRWTIISVPTENLVCIEEDIFEMCKI